MPEQNMRGVRRQPVALAMRYSDDEPGSPSTWILYLDDRASEHSDAHSKASSPGGSAFSSLTAATSPAMTVVSAQRGSLSVEELLTCA